MLVDAAALGAERLGGAARAAARAGGRMTFGFRRAEILAAQANGVTLLVLGLAIVVEALRRLDSPPDVRGGLVVVTARRRRRRERRSRSGRSRARTARNLNVEGSYRHLLTDLYAFAGTALAGLIVWTTGFERADPIASLAVAGLDAPDGVAAPPPQRAVLLEAAPEGLSPDEIGDAIRAHIRA